MVRRLANSLELAKRLVDGERVGDVSRALGPDFIDGEPANESNGCGHGNESNVCVKGC